MLSEAVDLVTANGNPQDETERDAEESRSAHFDRIVNGHTTLDKDDLTMTAAWEQGYLADSETIRILVDQGPSETGKVNRVGSPRLLRTAHDIVTDDEKLAYFHRYTAYRERVRTDVVQAVDRRTTERFNKAFEACATEFREAVLNADKEFRTEMVSLYNPAYNEATAAVPEKKERARVERRYGGIKTMHTLK